MSYINDNLLENEKLIYSTGPHWIVFSPVIWPLLLAFLIWILLAGIFSGPIFAGFSLQAIACITLVLVSIYKLILAYVYYTTSEYAVTDKRVIIKVGWIRRTSLELMLDKVEGVLVDQSIVGRLLDYGVITVIGTGGTRDRYFDIPHPMEFRKQVQQQIENFETKYKNA